jgi:AhpD family alkylhydroperoxidase
MNEHQPRLSYRAFTAAAPAVHAALGALGKAVDDTGLDKALSELVKIRASQLNGCAFCLRMHLDLARRLGVAADKLDLVAVWREAGVFSAREMAALDWTEALTVLGSGGAPDDVHAELLRQFSETEALALTVAIGTINQWNRIGVGLRFAPQLAWPAPGAA